MFRPNMLKHAREKHPEARLLQYGGQNGGNGRNNEKVIMPSVEEVDIDHQVRVRTRRI